MHPNKAFRLATTEQNLAFARERGFGVLTLTGSDGPLASHIPFVLSEDGSTFGAHMVRSNPILQMLEKSQPSLMIVSGPHAYVSPDWYGIDDQVPTWNYVSVHIQGMLQKLPDDRLRPHLQILSRQFEQRLAPKPPWTIDKLAPEALAKLEKMIVPVEFTITTVKGTWKLSQNKPDQARRGAMDGVIASGIGQMATELAELMRKID